MSKNNKREQKNKKNKNKMDLKAYSFTDYKMSASTTLNKCVLN